MTSQTTIFSINGVIDPNKTVWNNMELIAAAAASWVTYDYTTGLYGVVINKPDNPVASFDDDNIIGSITLSETDYESLYNACEISFPNRDIVSRVDYIRFDEGIISRYDFEPDNTLTLSSDLINDSVQADVIAITELKQSRQNKVVRFSSDFTALAINPGDVIRLTNEYWGWSNKLFRVTQVVEEDRDDGSIVVNITAIEYNDEVYAYNTITRFDRSTSTGIGAVTANTTVVERKDESVGEDVGRALQTDLGKQAITTAGIPVYDSLQLGFTSATLDNLLNTGGAFGGGIFFDTNAVKLLQINLEGPQATVNYDVYINQTLVQRQYVGAVPLYVTVEYSTDGNTYNLIAERYLEWTGNITTFNLVDQQPGYYRLRGAKTNTLVLDQDSPGATAGVIAINNVATTTQASGDAASITFVVLE